MATNRLKPYIENCGQTAAHRDMVTIDGTCRRSIQRHHCQPSATYRSATIPHDCHSRVHNDPSRSSKVNDFRFMEKNLCDFLLVICNNLGSISHRYGVRPVFGPKTHIFPTPVHSTPNLKMFPCHCVAQMFRVKSLGTGLIARVKSFS